MKVDKTKSGEVAGDPEALTADIPDAFLHKVYLTVTLKLLLSITIISTFIVFTPLNPIAQLGSAGGEGIALHFIIPLIGLALLYNYRKQTPANYLLLLAFTVGVSYLVAFTCAYFAAGRRISSWKVNVESTAMTMVVFASLSCYAFHAAMRGRDFSFLELFLLKSVALLMFLLFLQIVFQWGEAFQMVVAGLGSIVYYGYIVCFTRDLVTRFSYEDHIWASLFLYLHIIALFQFLFLFALFIASNLLSC